MGHNRVFNFSAGPSTIPEPVLETAQKELLNYSNAGMSVMEMSHRSKEFTAVLENSINCAKELLKVPETHEVLYIQGGASLQFAMAPLNFYRKGHPIDVVHTGYWVKKALGEIKKSAEANIVFNGESDNYMKLPNFSELKFNPDASYVHICSNNTIFGTQFAQFPKTPTPLVADMSSDIFSRPLDISQFGLIFAGAQKNLGPSGLAIAIIDKKWCESGNETPGSFLKYRSHLEGGSRFHTPPTFGIYMAGLVLQWIKDQGGVEEMQKINEKKAALLYDAIDRSDSFYSCPVQETARSQMNVVYRIQPDSPKSEELEKKFLAGCQEEGLSGLKGHRSVGGLRASIYNAMPLPGVEKLVDFMERFRKTNS